MLQMNLETVSLVPSHRAWASPTTRVGVGLPAAAASRHPSPLEEGRFLAPDE